MKHKTSELTGALLDAAVAKAEGLPYKVSGAEKISKTLVMALGPIGEPWFPSSLWGHGGPIIEREKITVGPAMGRDGWWAGDPKSHRNDGYGPTPLIAAMRAYVASKLGDEVDL